MLYNLYQNPKWFFWRYWEADPKIHIEMQETQNI